MDELHENHHIRNFTMLSRKMYALFLQYILSGRIRAPPEVDLTFLISTFQYGAKTHRRALQSKFKSWAKRMVVENHKLKLICTGKEIIPVEDSCKIVMHAHFQGHLSVDKVIEQIQKKYTWTKKNFGLDREMIVDFILKNCNNPDCIRAIESSEAARNYQCDDFIKDVILSSESRIYNIHNLTQPRSLHKINPPALYDSPIGHPLSMSLCDTDSSFQSDIKITDVRSMDPVSDNSTEVTSSEGFPKSNVPENTNDLKNINLKAETPLGVTPRSFIKPKNVKDFKSLLRAAEQFTDYPAILYSPKTKFLGSFGLAPKRICSKRTLSRVEKEKKQKMAQAMQNMRYHKNRKNLRDRNKLNKIKLKEQLEKRAYLEKFERNSVGGQQKVVSNYPSFTVQHGSNSFVSSSDESNNVISSADDGEIEIHKIVSMRDEPEVIEILSSSDDENNNNKNSTPKNKRVCDDITISMVGNKRSFLMKSSFDETKTLSSQHLTKVGNLKLNQQDKKTPNIIGSMSNSIHPETKYRYYPIFKQPYLLPSNSKGEVAILPSSQCTSKALPNRNKSVSYLNSQTTKPGKLSTPFMQGKKAILQPISNVAKIKSFSMQKLPISGISSKIPDGTNVYLVHKQPGGVIKMVPCSRVVATNNAIAQCSKETPKADRPISVNSANHLGIQAKTKYRSIRPTPDGLEGLSSQKTLDANKHLINEEMAKLSKWIGGMKSTMTRTYFQLNVQRSKQKLEAQLNAAIALVKNIRRKLWEIEKLEEQVCCNNFVKETRNSM